MSQGLRGYVSQSGKRIKVVYTKALYIYDMYSVTQSIIQTPMSAEMTSCLLKMTALSTDIVVCIINMLLTFVSVNPKSY